MALTLTKHTHACVRLEHDGQALVIDPGVFSPDGELPAALDGAAGVLITHQHADHLAPDALRSAVAGSPDLQVWVPGDVADSLAELGDRVHTVAAGDTFTAAGMTITAVGGRHAVIHPLEPMAFVDNLGYLVHAGDATVYHPGDALVVPEEPVTTLLVPAHAPWSKTAEVVDFAIATRATRAHPVHDGLLNERGLGLVDRLVSTLAGRYGVDYSRLSPGETTSV